MENSSLESME
jgi:hypothetical protein